MEDIKSYVELMKNALKEKLFFLDYINLNDYDNIVDFGCANGALLQNIYVENNAKFIGYDHNSTMINFAKKEQNSLQKNLYFTSNFDEINDLKGKSLIILSSVLHENEKNHVAFSSTLSLLEKFDTIVIRDMYFDEKLNKSISSFDRQILKDKIKPYIFNEFEEKYGKITTLKQYYHLLLKYDYEKNWANEILEDYFSFDFNRLISTLLNENYEIKLFSHEILKFKKDKVENELKIDYNMPTHLKLILKRK